MLAQICFKSTMELVDYLGLKVLKIVVNERLGDFKSISRALNALNIFIFASDYVA